MHFVPQVGIGPQACESPEACESPVVGSIAHTNSPISPLIHASELEVSDVHELNADDADPKFWKEEFLAARRSLMKLMECQMEHRPSGTDASTNTNMHDGPHAERVLLEELAKAKVQLQMAIDRANSLQRLLDTCTKHATDLERINREQQRILHETKESLAEQTKQLNELRQTYAHVQLDVEAKSKYQHRLGFSTKGQKFWREASGLQNVSQVARGKDFQSCRYTEGRAMVHTGLLARTCQSLECSQMAREDSPKFSGFNFQLQNSPDRHPQSTEADSIAPAVMPLHDVPLGLAHYQLSVPREVELTVSRLAARNPLGEKCGTIWYLLQHITSQLSGYIDCSLQIVWRSLVNPITKNVEQQSQLVVSQLHSHSSILKLMGTALIQEIGLELTELLMANPPPPQMLSQDQQTDSKDFEDLGVQTVVKETLDAETVTEPQMSAWGRFQMKVDEIVEENHRLQAQVATLEEKVEQVKQKAQSSFQVLYGAAFDLHRTLFYTLNSLFAHRIRWTKHHKDPIREFQVKDFRGKLRNAYIVFCEHFGAVCQEDMRQLTEFSDYMFSDRLNIGKSKGGVSSRDRGSARSSGRSARSSARSRDSDSDPWGNDWGVSSGRNEGRSSRGSSRGGTSGKGDKSGRESSRRSSRESSRKSSRDSSRKSSRDSSRKSSRDSSRKSSRDSSRKSNRDSSRSD
mmetsp:Transcript_123486/g.214152  ORF Transcript_123486/g.214152 Transcript_123486/m.214152 type:complete len:688 (-) Transcript_123486:317-2380(-)